MSEARHVSVLLNECIDNLNIRPEGIYLDGTLGLGGHSYEIASRLTSGRLIGIDRDETAIARAGRRLEPFGERVTLIHGNFSMPPRYSTSWALNLSMECCLTSVCHPRSWMKHSGVFPI